MNDGLKEERMKCGRFRVPGKEQMNENIQIGIERHREERKSKKKGYRGNPISDTIVFHTVNIATSPSSSMRDNTIVIQCSFILKIDIVPHQSLFHDSLMLLISHYCTASINIIK